MKKFYKRIFITLAAALVVVTSAVFFANFQDMPKSEPEVSMPEPETTAPRPAEEMGAETPSAPEAPAPPEDLEPRASTHFLMSEYACDCAGYCDGWPVDMNPELLEKIEALRCTFDCPVIITSGLRGRPVLPGRGGGRSGAGGQGAGHECAALLQAGVCARRGQRLGSFTFPMRRSRLSLSSAAFQAHDPARAG